MNERTIERLNNLYRNKISENQKKELKAELKSDAEFAKRAKEYLEMFAAIEAVGEAGLKAQLIQEYKRDEKSKVRTLFTKYYQMAAVILVIIALPFSYLYLNDTPSCQDLFTTNFEPLSEESMRNSTAITPMSNALQLYDTKKYNAAISAFLVLSESDLQTASAQIYLAISYLAVEKPKEAIPYLESVKTGTSMYKTDAAWYLILAHLQMDNKVLAKESIIFLETLNAVEYSQKIKDLKSELD